MLCQSKAVPVIAGAASLVFPGTKLLGGGEAGYRFYYDFLFPFEFGYEHLAMLEDGMRLCIKQEPELREMVPYVTSEYLKSLGQNERAKMALEEEETLHVIEWGEGVDFSTEPFEPIGAVKLLDFEKRGRAVRIHGVCGEDRKEVTQLAKMEEPGRDLFRFVEGELVYLPKGWKLYQWVIAKWREVTCDLDEVKTFGDVCEAHIALGLKRSCELRAEIGSGLSAWDPNEILKDSVVFIGKEDEIEQMRTSCLQLIQKMSTILGLNDTVDLPPLCDLLGREWEGPSIDVKEFGEELHVVQASLLGSVERVVAWLSESERWKSAFENQ
ncbi:MAG: hypothetical protein MRY21_07285 [Simkaniaceae bacterium]|nr:hypothetical protein [Simkaniaceae bacterium]